MLDFDFSTLRRRTPDVRDEAGDAAGDAKAHILTVCTGNVCRSPLAEQLLRARLGGYPAVVTSAGTQGLSDRPMDADAARMAQSLGVPADDSARHRGRWLDETHLRAPALVLVMDREHRRQVVELSPALVSRTFTIREFARLSSAVPGKEFHSVAETAGTDPSARVRAVTKRVLLGRGQAPSLLDPAEDDIVDPYRRPWEEYQRSTAQLVPAVDEVGRVMREALR